MVLIINFREQDRVVFFIIGGWAVYQTIMTLFVATQQVYQVDYQ